VSIGDVLGDSWELYRQHFTHFVSIAFVYFLVLGLITFLLALTLSWIGALASAFVSLVGIFWLQGALVEAIADVRDGRADFTIAETFSRARPYIWRLLGAGLLAALGIVIGLILLIIPGLILLTWWSLIIPVIVLERVAAMDSFARSRELVRGHGWSVFGVIIITAILVAIASGAVRSIFDVFLPAAAAYYLGSVIGNSLFVPFSAIAWTLMYYKLAHLEVGVEETAPDPATS
jgi:hypothetical protein